jgi:hypothetical protein
VHTRTNTLSLQYRIFLFRSLCVAGLSQASCAHLLCPPPVPTSCAHLLCPPPAPLSRYSFIIRSFLGCFASPTILHPKIQGPFDNILQQRGERERDKRRGYKEAQYFAVKERSGESKGSPWQTSCSLRFRNGFCCT